MENPVNISVDGGAETQVELGGTYRISGIIGESIEVVISTTSGDTLQILTIITSCKEGGDLTLLKDYGALQLIAFENQSQGYNSILADITLIYSVENVGNLNAIVTSVVRNSAFSGEEELINVPPVLPTGQSLSWRETLFLNLAEAKNLPFQFELDVLAATEMAVACPTQASYNFTVA
jgi:hypothetical protein